MNRRAAAALAVACLCAAAGAGCTVYVHEKKPAPIVVSPTPAPTSTVQVVRRKCTYRYYPEARVYYSVDRDLWFYMESGRWQVSGRLPGWVRAELDTCVTVDLETERPYEQHKSVVVAHPSRHGYDKWEGEKPGHGYGRDKRLSSEDDRDGGRD